jgi:AcrR family transcriptional regulator
VPRAEARVTRRRLVDVAVALLDEGGPQALTLAALAAALGVRSPSLYHHVAGLEGLRRELRVEGLERLGDALQRASSGRARRDALDAVARAYVAFGRAHPGLYALTLAGAVEDDARVRDAAQRLLGTVLAVLRGYRLEADAALHATRYLRSTLHGFVALERSQGFAMPLAVDASLDRLVDALDGGLERLAATAA